MQPAEMSLIVMLLSAVLAGALTWMQIRRSVALRLTAAPRADRWHKRPTPTSGGVAVFLSCAAVYAFAGNGRYSPVAAGTALIALLGFIDDRVQLKPAWKLAGQAVAAAGVVASGVTYAATPWHWANLLLAFLWIVGLTNAFNLIDNMDGLCAGVVVIICGFRFGLLAAAGYWSDALLFGILGGSFAGFLVFNYSPARIFMGDCGSMLAGFSLASLTLASARPHAKIVLAGVFYPALTFIYPIFDTVLVSVLRRLAGRPISMGGRDHSSHRLAGLGIGERNAVWLLWLLTGAGSFSGLMAAWMTPGIATLNALLVVAVTVFGIFLASLPPYAVSLADLAGASWVRRRIPTVRAGAILVVDTLLAALALAIAFLVRFDGRMDALQTKNLLLALPVVIVCHTGLACIQRTYSVSWRWLTLRDAAALAGPALLSAALATLLMRCFGARYFSRQAMLLFCLLSPALSIALRASLRLLQDLADRRPAEGRRIAVLGADSHGELLANLLERLSSLNLQPVVFFDKDCGREGLRIRGLPVRHCGSNVGELCAEFRVGAAVAPAGALENGNRELALRCQDAGLRLLTLDVSLRDTA